MTEVETLLSDAAFTRPTSLYMPERVVQSALIDSSSYTPFPSFPGSSRARDPFGLNAFLLPPDDKSWHYIDPSPAPGLVSAEPAGQLAPVAGPSSIRAGGDAPLPPQRQSSLRKQRSMSVFHRPSPLGQPPLELPPVQRRRSNSVGSQNSVKEDKDDHREDEDEAAKQARRADDDFAPGAPRMATSRSRNGYGSSASSKKNLKTSLFKASKSMFRISDASGPIPRSALSAPPSPTASSSSSTGPAPERHSDDSAEGAAKGTPKSSRSNSTFSTLSSASSVSSEGPHTPSEVPAEGQDAAVAGEKLADALAGAAAADAADRRKGWKSWLGGNKRATKSAAPAASSPLAASPADSPASSKIDLIGPPGGVVEDETPSRVATPPSRSLTGSPSGLTHSWVGESLRRASLRKVQALRRPSPHPLAMHLRRQHCPLPDEVAFSLQAGLRMFPKSVNAPSNVLTPNQGGLATTLAIKSVLRALDAGRLPVGLLSARRSSVENPTGNLRPKGITDFIRRPPFEDRMMVFYPDGKYSPISTARPGFAVWDLDFSAYVQALAELDKPFSRRPSTTGGGEHFRSQGAVSPGALLVPPPMVDEVDAAIADDSAEILVTPPLDATAGSLLLARESSTGDVAALAADASEAAIPVPQTEAGSSFRKSRAQPVTWLDSSESESSDEDEDEDDAPLSRPRMSRSTTGRDLKTRTSSLSDGPEGRPSAALPRSSSTTAVDLLAPAPRRSIEYPRPNGTPEKRRSHLPASQSAGLLWDVKRQQDALDEVVRARERRVANNAGEAEKRAEAQTRAPLRSAMKGGRSSVHVDVSPAPSSPEKGNDVRRQSRSTFEPAVTANRSPKRGSAGEGGKSPSSRRYHSFYDLPAAGGADAVTRSPPRPVVAPLPQFRHTQSYAVPMYGHHPAYHPGFVLPAPIPTVAPVLPHSGSMRFPSAYGQFPQHSLPTLAPAPGYLPHSASMGSLALSLGPPGDRRTAHRSTRAS